MSTWPWIVATYIAIGFLLTVVGPLRKDLEAKILVMAATNPAAPQWKASVLRYGVLSGVVLLWVFFLPGVLRKNAQVDLGLGREHLAPGVGTVGGGIRFDHMGGAGKICCVDCGYAEDVMSFTHGSVGNSTGYQCQICGKFTSRNYEEPFADSGGYSPRRARLRQSPPNG